MKLSQGVLATLLLAQLFTFSVARAQSEAQDSDLSNNNSQLVSQPAAFQQQEDKILSGTTPVKKAKKASKKVAQSQVKAKSESDSDFTAGSNLESEPISSVSDNDAIQKDSLVTAMEDAVNEGAKKSSKSKSSRPQKIAVQRTEKLMPDAEQVLAGLDDKSKTLTLDNEMTASNTDAFNEAADTSLSETRQTQKEIKDLEHQLNSAKTAESRAIKKSVLQAKRLELAKRLAKETSSKLAVATARQISAEKKLARLQAQVDAAEKRVQDGKSKTANGQAEISKLEASNNEMSRRLKVAQVQILRDKKKLKSLHDKRSKLARENHALQRKVAAK